MSSKPAIIRQRDVTRILKGAAAAGIALGVVIRDGEARFVPVDELVAANEPSALEAWRARRDARKAGGRA
jgi:hypothetical protein